MKKNFKKKAFTLIEISIVLVIIGIILASVMKGRDLIKGSQIKEFNQVFVSQWETIANSYFSRMANVLGDGEINGGTAGEEPDGFMDGEDSNTTLQALTDSGIEVTELIKSDLNDPFYRTVDGEMAGKCRVKIGFCYYKINGKSKNALVFMNIPNDIAQAIDTIRDGQPDGTKGSVLAVQTKGTSGDDSVEHTLWDAGSTITPVEWNDIPSNTRYVKHMLVILEH
ncbi:MAG: prepilin-type N-terminal cleavage/methylation domain-containing protein [Campylobacterota bacterium]|nr:prepilin-type N-terminal cleavage/methylation domain-containing protein [Campylobacterota bacterium]